MPPKSSSSSSSRRPSPRKPRKKVTPSVEQEVNDVVASDDHDFGAGIVEDEPASSPRPAPAPRSERRERRERPQPAPAPAPVIDDEMDFIRNDDIDLGDDDEGEGSFNPNEETSEGEDGDRRPRRRRRRRGRRNEGGPTSPQGHSGHSSHNSGGHSSHGGHSSGSHSGGHGSSHSGSHSGGGHSSSGHGGGGGHSSGGHSGSHGGGHSGGYSSHGHQGGHSGGGGYRQSSGGGRSGDGGRGGDGGYNRGRRDQNQPRGRSNAPGNRGRRISKFEQNAAPSEPAATSGTIEGVLELHPKGYGFLRAAENDYGARETDAFISSSFVEKHHLREGIKIRGEIGPGTRGQGPRLLTIESIDGGPVEDYEKLKHFDTLTAINPFEQIKLETGPSPVTMRVMDLLTPIGKGQRALIVAPPRTGKTMLLQDIANAVSKNHPEIHLIVLLIDERPEEVTEMRRTIRGEVIASSMDQDVESHVRISQLVIERGKRLAESGKDCFILMDSITRTARAFNKWMRGGRDTKIQTGGLDVRAMDIPRKMFGTARRFDEGGSLTVCATALIDTGSKMDDAIFQEFKGTGNMELVLSRDLAERRIWPAIDITRSGTRREEKIIDPELLDGITMLRRSLVSMNPTEAMDQLIRTLGKFETNREFLQKIRAVL